MPCTWVFCRALYWFMTFAQWGWWMLGYVCALLCLGTDWCDAISSCRRDGRSQAPWDVLGWRLQLPADSTAHSFTPRLCHQQRHSGEPALCLSICVFSWVYLTINTHLSYANNKSWLETPTACIRKYHVSVRRSWSHSWSEHSTWLATWLA